VGVLTERDGFRRRRIFTRFAASVYVIAHEPTHGITQFAAALGVILPFGC